MTESTIASEFRTLSPSAKFVHSTLERDGPLTFQELYHKTALPKSTLSDGIHELDDEGFIEPASVFAPLSKRKYQLA